MSDNNDIDAGKPRGILPLPQTPDEPPPAWRLTFEYDETGVELVARQRVTMLAPADDSPRTFAARAGYWIELTDAEGHGVYRQILVDPLQSHYEVHSPEPGAQPVRVPALPGYSGVFQVVVPDLPEAVQVVLKGLAEPGPAATLDLRLRDTAFAILTAPLRPEDNT